MTGDSAEGDPSNEVQGVDNAVVAAGAAAMDGLCIYRRLGFMRVAGVTNQVRR